MSEQLKTIPDITPTSPEIAMGDNPYQNYLNDLQNPYAVPNSLAELDHAHQFVKDNFTPVGADYMSPDGGSSKVLVERALENTSRESRLFTDEDYIWSDTLLGTEDQPGIDDPAKLADLAPSRARDFINFVKTKHPDVQTGEGIKAAFGEYKDNYSKRRDLSDQILHEEADAKNAAKGVAAAPTQPETPKAAEAPLATPTGKRTHRRNRGAGEKIKEQVDANPDILDGILDKKIDKNGDVWFVRPDGSLASANEAALLIENRDKILAGDPSAESAAAQDPEDVVNQMASKPPVPTNRTHAKPPVTATAKPGARGRRKATSGTKHVEQVVAPDVIPFEPAEDNPHVVHARKGPAKSESRRVTRQGEPVGTSDGILTPETPAVPASTITLENIAAGKPVATARRTGKPANAAKTDNQAYPISAQRARARQAVDKIFAGGDNPRPLTSNAPTSGRSERNLREHASRLRDRMHTGIISGKERLSRHITSERVQKSKVGFMVLKAAGLSISMYGAAKGVETAGLNEYINHAADKIDEVTNGALHSLTTHEVGSTSVAPETLETEVLAPGDTVSQHVVDDMREDGLVLDGGADAYKPYVEQALTLNGETWDSAPGIQAGREIQMPDWTPNSPQPAAATTELNAFGELVEKIKDIEGEDAALTLGGIGAILYARKAQKKRKRR